MFRAGKFLKVVSVIMIIIGILGVIFNLLSYRILSSMQEVQGIDTSAITPLNLVIAICGMLCCTMAGLFVLIGKSFKVTAALGGLYSVIILYNIISSILVSGFSYIYIFNFILPCLFWWGLYQSDCG